MQSDVERFLARLFADADLRLEFFLNPKRVARQHGLSEKECCAMETVSLSGLRAAAQSYERKRSFKLQHGKNNGLKAWLLHLADVTLSIAARMGA